ncbi:MULTISPECIES: peptidoglycan-associated lipoprotein Pal [Oceanospirillaceae]|jgi:peptidoglycan-associated lipoprotein|uniref:peptidoglycan-associated lipoprotein Pal n=1 Tax=Oceanospirillaceae TaxID=135620 RepID=UPI0011963026|nr:MULTISPECIES: peptidoglycan-associated lipoprotein Pal [Thalassolituus]MBU2039294.1 peptidoglycan-associated lipoprotein Pal [Gammaproteobacteria bacterium]MCA6058254.1 peptidoglycan-associated lipoprotein Pal [Thalassolituus sp. ST750PaO-4]MCB2386652.1 peptidoglycan-associated lipoprotein Pal [Thalassolituus alkanivorans]MCB2424170.1 peptidoglycan-associated lipoprotein Pal [Thalassolituus alkanivorans]TVV42274.1 peptidoglycan-associated lipoprotein Pal [Thalassolituus sp. C2-1]
MQTTALYKTLGLAFGAMLISACASKGDVNEGAGSTVAPTATEQQAEDTNAVESAGVNGEALEAEANEAQAALREQTVFYFDFDQSTLKSEGKAALMAHAAFLAANPAASVVLEGHADERGTVEYNLALGERRSMTVRRFLMANGANGSQLKVVSFGEERPVMMGHDEGSYAKNRRVEVKYQSR